MNYEFVHLNALQNPREPYTPPGLSVLDRIADMERRVGPLPLSVCAWYEIVGYVDLIGRFPDWPEANWLDESDPLVVHPEEDIPEYDEDNWHRERYSLQIAPDYYHKDNVSGGAPYTIQVPHNAVDAPLEYEWHETTFVNYLRQCFNWGGIPGWYKSPPDSRQAEVVAELSRGLLPI